METKTNHTEEKKGEISFEYPIVGKSKAVDQLIKQISSLAKGRRDVMIVGEAGAGKGAIAKNIYIGSTGGRADEPFMSINLSVLDDRELEAVCSGTTAALRVCHIHPRGASSNRPTVGRS